MGGEEGRCFRRGVILGVEGGGRWEAGRGDYVGRGVDVGIRFRRRFRRRG